MATYNVLHKNDSPHYLVLPRSHANEWNVKYNSLVHRIICSWFCCCISLGWPLRRVGTDDVIMTPWHWHQTDHCFTWLNGTPLWLTETPSWYRHMQYFSRTQLHYPNKLNLMCKRIGHVSIQSNHSQALLHVMWPHSFQLIGWMSCDQ